MECPYSNLMYINRILDAVDIRTHGTEKEVEIREKAFIKHLITFLIHKPDMPEFSDKKLFERLPLYEA